MKWLKYIFIGMASLTTLTTGGMSIIALRGNVEMLYQRGLSVEIFLAMVVFLLSAWALLLFLILNLGRSR